MIVANLIFANSKRFAKVGSFAKIGNSNLDNDEICFAAVHLEQ
jgi:hypothetical protein